MPDHQRLFLALWPPAPVQAVIAECARQAADSGRLVPPKRLHLTLAFLGDVDSATRDALITRVAAIDAAAVDLTLARFGYFPRARIVWLGPRQAPDALLSLAAALRDAARAVGIRLPSSPFRPHVTLARLVGPPGARGADVSVRWQARHFSLSESVFHQGRAQYRDLARFPLSTVSVTRQV